MQVAAIFLITLLFINYNTVIYSKMTKCKKSTLRYTFVLIPAADDFQTIMKIVGTSRSAIVNRSWKDKDIVEITVDSEDFDQIYQTSKSLKVYSYHSTFCIPSTTKSSIPITTTPKILTSKIVTQKTKIINSTTPKFIPLKNTTQKLTPPKSATQKNTPSKSVTQKNQISKNSTTKITSQKVVTKKTEISKSVTQKMTQLKGVTQKITPSKSVTKITTPKSLTKKTEISKSVTQKMPTSKYVTKNIVTSKNVTKKTNSKNVTQKPSTLKTTMSTKIIQNKEKNQTSRKDKKNSKRSVRENDKNREKRSLHYYKYKKFPQLWLDLKNVIYNIYSTVFTKCKWYWNNSYLITSLPVECNRNYHVTTTESITNIPIDQIVNHQSTLPIRHRNWNIHKFLSSTTTTTTTIENSADSEKNVSKLKIIKNNNCEKMIDCDADQNEVELVYQQWD